VANLSAEDRIAIEQASNAYVAAMRGEDWKRVAQSFSANAVRVPPHEEPHQGRKSIESWLRGIEELSNYELVRDQIDGADGIAYIRGSYAITLRPVGVPVAISDEGDFLEIWRKDPDGTWTIAEAMWNTRRPMSA
jgi:ketosteroid isomerase-like protein